MKKMKNEEKNETKYPFLRCISCSNRFRDLRHLRPRPHDPIPIFIPHRLHLLILLLCSLPNFHLTAATDDPNPHRRQQIVRCVGMVVHPAVKHGSGILADTGVDHRFTARVVLDEIRDVMDDTGNGDETAAVLSLVDVVVPFNDGELLERDAPVELRAALVDFLLQLLNTALFDLVGAELLEVVGETKLLPDPDCPFGRVVLVPFDGVAVVRGEFVVEVVVAFAEGDEGGDDVVAWGVAVIEGLVT